MSESSFFVCILPIEHYMLDFEHIASHAQRMILLSFLTIVRPFRIFCSVVSNLSDTFPSSIHYLKLFMMIFYN